MENYLDQSDEDFLNGSSSPEEETTEEVNQEETVDNGTEEADGSLLKDESQADLTNENNSTTVDTQGDEALDYKELYTKIMTPIKANGKEISLKSPDEAIQLMQMGANYTKKMQAIAPYRKTLMMLEKNGLMNDSAISYLIDLNNKNPEAIRKLLKDSNIDPLDIDTSAESHYVAGANSISDQEVNFRTAIDDLKAEPNGLATLQVINNSWDDSSKDLLMAEPGKLHAIHDQINSGVYKIVTDEMDRLSTLGQLPANTPFLEAYIAVGNKLLQEKQAMQQPLAERPAMTRNGMSNDSRVRQAGLVRTNPATAKSSGINPLSMSDDDFLKQFEGRV